MLINFAHGAEAVELAGKMWLELGGRQKRMVLWDVPLRGRGEALREAAGKAILAGFASVGGRLVACAWVQAIGRFTGNIHFIARGNYEQAITAGEYFLRQTEALHFKALLGLVPQPWRGARRLAHALGFRTLAMLPGACRIEHAGRYVNGELMYYTSHDFYADWPPKGRTARC